MNMQDYCLSMEEKYPEKIKQIDSILLSRGSQECGIWLYDVLHSRFWQIKPELKYYILKNTKRGSFIHMENGTIRIVNPIQAGAYVKNGLEPIKIYWNKDKWVWEFNRQASKPLFKKWCRREL
ncbi:hypothetical protein [Clostridium sp. JNZ J1-5]